MGAWYKIGLGDCGKCTRGYKRQSVPWIRPPLKNCNSSQPLTHFHLAHFLGYELSFTPIENINQPGQVPSDTHSHTHTHTQHII